MQAILVMPMLFACQPSEAEWRPSDAASTRRVQEVLVLLLAEDEFWTHWCWRDDLMEALELAQTMPDPKLAPVLVKRTMFIPNRGLNPFRHSIGEIAPVVGILIRIGPAAVPSVIEELKNTEAGTDEALMLTRVIFHIYNEGGFGRDLARQRLELELSRTKNARERANLLHAIDWLIPRGSRTDLVLSMPGSFQAKLAE